MLEISEIASALKLDAHNPKAHMGLDSLSDIELAKEVHAKVIANNENWMQEQVAKGKEVIATSKAKVAALYTNLNRREKALGDEKIATLEPLRNTLAEAYKAPLRKEQRMVLVDEARSAFKKAEADIDSQNAKTMKAERNAVEAKVRHLEEQCRQDVRSIWYGTVSMPLNALEKRIRDSLLTIAKTEVDIQIHDIEYSQLGLGTIKVANPVPRTVREGVREDERDMPTAKAALQALDSFTTIYIPASGKEEESTPETQAKSVNLQAMAVRKTISLVMKIAQAINATKPTVAKRGRKLSRTQAQVEEFIPSYQLADIIALANEGEDISAVVETAEGKVNATRTGLKTALLQQAGLSKKQNISDEVKPSLELGAKAYKTLGIRRLMELATDSSDVKFVRTVEKRIQEVKDTHANVVLALAKKKTNLPAAPKPTAEETAAEQARILLNAARRNLAQAIHNLDAFQEESPADTAKMVTNHLQGHKGSTSHIWMLETVALMIHQRASTQVQSDNCTEGEVRSYPMWNAARISAMSPSSFEEELMESLKKEGQSNQRFTMKKIVTFIWNLSQASKVILHEARKTALELYANDAQKALKAVQDNEPAFELVRIGSLRRIDQIIEEDSDVTQVTQAFIRTLARMREKGELHNMWLAKLESIIDEVTAFDATFGSEIQTVIDALIQSDYGEIVTGGKYIYYGEHSGRAFAFSAAAFDFAERETIEPAEMELEDLQFPEFDSMDSISA